MLMLYFSYVCFFDNVFVILGGGCETLYTFDDQLNSMLPGLKFILSWGETSIPFMDVRVYKMVTICIHTCM